MPTELLRHQQRFTAWLRDPLTRPCPDDVPPRRMQAYRELVTNNVAAAVNACYPVLRSLLGDARWEALVLEFFTQHRCHSPIYREIPHEFLNWLQQPATNLLSTEFPWLLELAQYEWLELALDIDPAEIPARGINPAGDLLTGIPVLNPLTRLLRYTWPVHKIGPDFRPAQPSTEPVRLTMARNRQHEIGFLEINPLVERLLEKLRDNKVQTGEALLQALAKEFPAIPEPTLIAGGTSTLHELKNRDIVLGTRIEQQ